MNCSNEASFIGNNAERVAANYRELAGFIGCARERIFEVSQNHGSGVRVVGPGERVFDVRSEKADALVAHKSSIAVGVRVADCLSLLLADPFSGAVAAVHVGWRGAVAGVLEAAIRALIADGSTAAYRLHAALFPHIRPCCFEVGEEVAHALVSACENPDVIVGGYTKPHVDLALVVKTQLNRSGIADPRIDDIAGCTCCDQNRFFSYRRDGDSSGRHLVVIAARG
ncbi:MAG: laccase domain-containing protein [Deltaproteobacteria bacterium]|nr:laccase domain-containing protein [Deltaproteobacteria bacterium]